MGAKTLDYSITLHAISSTAGDLVYFIGSGRRTDELILEAHAATPETTTDFPSYLLQVQSYQQITSNHRTSLHLYALSLIFHYSLSSSTNSRP